MSGAEHPFLKQIREAIRKGNLSASQRRDFEKFRANPEKCPEGSPAREQADALAAEIAKLPAPEAPRPVAPQPQPMRGGFGGPRGRGGPAPGRGPMYGAREPAPRPSSPQRGASAAVLGEAFHNPYTFLPFGKPRRMPPTPLTIDEVEKDRITGLVELELETLSPLLTCDPEPIEEKNGHRTYRVLSSGADVIVPATGVRGALRTLMTILTGGTLGYADELAWLCQGRDTALGPRSEKAPNPAIPKNCFLAEVLEPGSDRRSGRVRVARASLVKAAPDGRNDRYMSDRPKNGQRQPKLFCGTDGQPTKRASDQTPHRLKLSGRPVQPKGKREGYFEGGTELQLGPELWAAYLGRHRHAEFPSLERGDLVWLEPADLDAAELREARDVKSIQWARWGRRGERLLDVLAQRHAEVVPDALRDDGLVDEVTNLFGQVPVTAGAAKAFAARIRPENLVFEDAIPNVDRVTLAPLAPPHLGCAAFYRESRNASEVDTRSGRMRGYKVYRTTRERGVLAPWLFTTQGVYGRNGELDGAPQKKVNKTCDLLREGQVGRLRISFRALSRRELALLLLACSVDWRLGGGKPLGLGACRPRRVTVTDELGAVLHTLERSDEMPIALPDELAREVAELGARVEAWQKSQLPVERLRYPRALDQNERATQRGGHVWFARHASPKKAERGGDSPRGLEGIHLRGDLRSRAAAEAIEGQILPAFDPSDPLGDVLYGYDVQLVDPEQSRDRRTYYARSESRPPRSGSAPAQDAAPPRKKS
ncbi:MAG: hypothetical protein U0230_20685 [Polyangiales bacterium]